MRIEFTAAESSRVLSRAIEECARGQGSLSAIMVQWESDDTTLSMAVTAVKGEGWAIEHTNLGTIRLRAAGGERTRVTIVDEAGAHPERPQLAALFDRFVHQIQTRFQVKSPSR